MTRPTNALRLSVLDHGSVTLRNISGPTRRLDTTFDADDIDPANAARMSFDQTDSDVIILANGGTRPRERSDDLKLCEYLIKNWHTTPFEMIEVWVEMVIPIFVARQFVRHRTVSINEVSGRYITLPDKWYIPKTVGGKAKNKKQGQEDNLDKLTQEQFRVALDRHCHRGYVAYTNSIDDGVAPEHARLFLSLNHYTHWMWKQDLHNLMHYLRLRKHSHAQIEAQQYAQAVYDLLKMFLPHSMELFDKYRAQET